MDSVEEFKKQHFLNYKKAIIEIISNNTDALYGEDIRSLFKIPPLESMDLLKTKIIFLAKQEDGIIDNDKLHEILDDYRCDIYKILDVFSEKRKKMLTNLVNNYNFDKNTIFKLTKKDFIEFDKKIRKELKDGINDSFERNILINVTSLFTKNNDNVSNFIEQLENYFNRTYLKQILDNYDFKLLVKNTILINGVKEQGERYNFTLENSRLFNE